MPTHRLDIGLGGMSHYVDGQLRGTSGLTRFPDGLRRDRKGGPEKKLVRKPGVGKTIEWESRGGRGNHNNEHRAGPLPRPPPRQPRGWPPGPQLERQEGQQRDEQQRDEPQDEDPRQFPGQFDVPEGEDDEEDAQSQAPSRRTEPESVHSRRTGPESVHSRRTGPESVHFQHHARHWQGNFDPDRVRTTMGFDYLEMRQREIENYPSRNGHPRGYDSPSRAMRWEVIDQIPFGPRGSRPRDGFLRDLPQWHRRQEGDFKHRSWR